MYRIRCAVGGFKMGLTSRGGGCDLAEFNAIITLDWWTQGTRALMTKLLVLISNFNWFTVMFYKNIYFLE